MHESSSTKGFWELGNEAILLELFQNIVFLKAHLHILCNLDNHILFGLIVYSYVNFGQPVVFAKILLYNKPLL